LPVNRAASWLRSILIPQKFPVTKERSVRTTEPTAETRPPPLSAVTWGELDPRLGFPACVGKHYGSMLVAVVGGSCRLDVLAKAAALLNFTRRDAHLGPVSVAG
jgi:hypothetical protein